ncbi:MAG: teicoplanin resistance protein VanZ [Deltaproteobacteria bacterium HGW-Deltaproteobacteria-15]|jgi:VanZ family protein|nr:MAG: teicoplanin resistance protein VanZ [Deltaproteobacteria bacterium HGW-Deltaproteobacteria-15]
MRSVTGNSKLWTRIAYALPALAVAGTIFYLSSLEKIDLPLGDVEYSDLLLHWAAYFVFGMTLLFAARPSERLREEPVWTYAVILAIGMAYGLSDEIHQFFVPNRSTSLADFFADTLGVAAAISARHLMWKYLNRRISNNEYRMPKEEP